MNTAPLVPLSALSKQNPFILALFVDGSSSMMKTHKETLDGVNLFLFQQRKIATPTVVHLTVFDTDVKHVYNAVPLEDVLPLTGADYTPRGGTALYDAVGAGLDALTRAYPGRRRGLVLVVTDGEEMDSRTYTFQQVRDAIAVAAHDGWDFVYIGSDLKSWKKGADLGMNAAPYDGTPQGTRAAYDTVSRSVVVLRTQDITSRGVKWTDGGGLEDVIVGSEGGRKFKRG